MAMPNHLVFVRHGESELNVVNRAEKAGRAVPILEGFDELHDWQYRLSPKGVRQAEMAGQWLSEQAIAPEDFDIRYVSTFMRARETAAYLGGAACTWLLDDRLKERDWGVYGLVAPADRAERFAETEKLRQLSSFYTRIDGGEGLADGVLTRFRDWLGTLHRDAENKKVLVVAHGELMWVARYAIEKMLPEEWDEADVDQSQRINNGSIIWYSRINPDDETDITPYIKWRKVIYPDNEPASPFGGEWVELPGKRWLSGDDLLKSVERVPPLIKRD